MIDQNQYDIVVVGAGLAGLTCTLELVEEGYKVLLIEANDFVGGRTSSWYDIHSLHK